MLNKQINIELQDTQWQFEHVDHDRNIARAKEIIDEIQK